MTSLDQLVAGRLVECEVKSVAGLLMHVRVGRRCDGSVHATRCVSPSAFAEASRDDDVMVSGEHGISPFEGLEKGHVIQVMIIGHDEEHESSCTRLICAYLPHIWASCRAESDAEDDESTRARVLDAYSSWVARRTDVDVGMAAVGVCDMAYDGKLTTVWIAPDMRLNLFLGDAQLQPLTLQRGPSSGRSRQLSQPFLVRGTVVKLYDEAFRGVGGVMTQYPVEEVVQGKQRTNAASFEEAELCVGCLAWGRVTSVTMWEVKVDIAARGHYGLLSVVDVADKLASTAHDVMEAGGDIERLVRGKKARSFMKGEWYQFVVVGTSKEGKAVHLSTRASIYVRALRSKRVVFDGSVAALAGGKGEGDDMEAERGDDAATSDTHGSGNEGQDVSDGSEDESDDDMDGSDDEEIGVEEFRDDVVYVVKSGDQSFAVPWSSEQYEKYCGLVPTDAEHVQGVFTLFDAWKKAELHDSNHFVAELMAHAGILRPQVHVRAFVQSVQSTGGGIFMTVGRNVSTRVTMTDCADEYVKDPARMFPIGMRKEGVVIGVRINAQGKLMIAMSLRQSSVQHLKAFEDVVKGAVYLGTVRRVESFGVFVNLDNFAKVVGMAHQSQLVDGDKAAEPSQVYKEGDRVVCVVLRTNNQRRQLSLSLKSGAVAEAGGVDAAKNAQDESAYGVFSDSDSDGDSGDEADSDSTSASSDEDVMDESDDENTPPVQQKGAPNFPPTTRVDAGASDSSSDDEEWKTIVAQAGAHVHGGDSSDNNESDSDSDATDGEMNIQEGSMDTSTDDEDWKTALASVGREIEGRGDYNGGSADDSDDSSSDDGAVRGKVWAGVDGDVDEESSGDEAGSSSDDSTDMQANVQRPVFDSDESESDDASGDDFVDEQMLSLDKPSDIVGGREVSLEGRASASATEADAVIDAGILARSAGDAAERRNKKLGAERSTAASESRMREVASIVGQGGMDGASGLKAAGKAKSAREHEQLVAMSPNTPTVWIAFMAHYLRNRDLVKARSVVQRALRTIGDRESEARVTMWQAWLNMEAQFGRPGKNGADVNDVTGLDSLATMRTGKSEKKSEGDDEFFRVLDMVFRLAEPLMLLDGAVSILERMNRISDAREVLRLYLKGKHTKGSLDVWLRAARFELEHDIGVKDGEERQPYEVSVRCARATDALMSHALTSGRFSSTEEKALVIGFARMHAFYGSVQRMREILDDLLAQSPKQRDVWSIFIDLETSVLDHMVRDADELENGSDNEGGDGDDDIKGELLRSAQARVKAQQASTVRVFSRALSIGMKRYHAEKFLKRFATWAKSLTAREARVQARKEVAAVGRQLLKQWTGEDMED